jgi:hypothetical protein
MNTVAVVLGVIVLIALLAAIVGLLFAGSREPASSRHNDARAAIPPRQPWDAEGRSGRANR